MMPIRLLFACIALVCSANMLHAQVIDLFPGDEIADNTVVADGTTINVLGGRVGLGVDLSNGIFNIESGEVAVGATGTGTGFTNSGNQINLSGGTVGGFFQVSDNSELNITGGEIESFGVDVFGAGGSTANISGGTISRFPDVFSGGVANISGGDIFAVRVFDGGEVNFFGTEFSLGGNVLDLNVGEEFVINDRNLTLSGILEDGSFIETDLNTTFGSFFGANPDGAGANARVTVTLVSAVPEPSSILLLSLVAMPMLARRRR